MGEGVLCPECGQIMQNLGNISNIFYTSYPVQWDDVYVCNKCKIKKVVRKQGEILPDNSYVDEYKEVK